MQNKKEYTRPTIDVHIVEAYCGIDSLSLGKNKEPASGGGDAKQYDFNMNAEE